MYPYHSPFLFSTSIEYFLYPRARSYDERPNCLTPLGIKSPSIIVEHEQPHGCNTIGCYGLDGILLAS